MKSWQALALIAVVWAGLYLPYLGSVELRGEEARRILPGRTMLQTGEWVVPKIGGEDYNRKPPLVNWTIAASFALTGIQNEWTARLPSVLWLLAFSMVAFLVLEKRLGLWRAACVPLFFLSTLGMMDKGRMAEIEAMYIAQFGIAYVMWAAWWSEGRKWMAYLLPWVFLGIGTLAKGPVHLLFWYPIIAFSLWRARELKELIRPPHLVGLVAMCAVFLPWMLSNVGHVEEPSDSTSVWWEQFRGRLTYESIDWLSWLEHPFQMVANFLPWSIFLIWFWWRLTPGLKQAPRDDRWVAVIRGSQFGIFVGMGMLLITPEGLPRYSMPLFAPACLVLADLFGRMPDSSLAVAEKRWRLANLVMAIGACAAAVIAPIGLGIAGHPVFVFGVIVAVIAGGAGAYYLWSRPRLEPVLGSCIALGGALLVFMTLAVPVKAEREKFRPAGQELTAATSNLDYPLTIFDPSHLRFLFYVDRPYTETTESSDLPDESGYLMIRPKTLGKDSVEAYLERFEKKELGRWEWEDRDYAVLELTRKPGLEPR